MLINPCVPSPCGPNSQCRDVGGSASCSCLVNYIGSPPNCRPECSINAECPSIKACIREKCRDPCPGSCGAGAQCSVINHTPICTCPEGFTGDPFTNCFPKPPERELNLAKDLGMYVNESYITAVLLEKDPCNPSPCGPNAQCNDGVCSCLPEYQGDPYSGCRPECVLSTECPKNKACIRNKCTDPCPGTCGQNAQCDVVNHIPMCSCPQGFSGNAFIECRPVAGMYKIINIHMFIILYQYLFYNTQPKLSQIHVIHHHVALTASVGKLTDRPCAPVYLDS